MELMMLIQQILQDDRTAYEILFRQYKNLVFRTAYLMLGDTHEAEEALQEVFLQVYKAINSYQPEKGAFSTWLYRITANYCKNQLRKRKYLLSSLSWVRETLWNQSSGSDHQWDHKEPVQKALKNLSEKVREVIVLRYYAEMSYVEIAEALDIPVGTVKSRLDMGLKMMRKELEMTYSEPGIDKKEVIK